MPPLSIRKIAIAILVFAFVSAARANTTAVSALKITPQNTVILDGSDYAGRLLQYQLIKSCVGPEAAAPYFPDAKINRAESPYFPLLNDKPDIHLPENKVIFAVGNSRFLTPEDRERLTQNPGSILISRRGSVVLISGTPFSGQTGTATAVCEFLDCAAGIRLYAPSELWRSKPKDGTFEIQSLELFRKQFFKTSFFAPYWKSHSEWLGLNQNGARMTLQCFHNLANIFPPEKFGNTHPQIYEMRGGQRRVPLSIGTKIWNPCLSAAELPSLAMDYIREQKRSRPTLSFISLGMMDIPFECQCTNCQESVKKHGSYSQLYFEFVNKVARSSLQEFPNLTITCFSYVNAKRPPTNLQFEPNVAVKIVIKSYMMLDPVYSKAQRAAILEFSNAGAAWFFHDWRFSGVTPRNDLPAVAEFLQWAAENRCVGAYYEYSPEQNFYLDGAYYWILMRLTSDPWLSVKDLWAQYCDDMFGAAAQSMASFFEHFEQRHATAVEKLGTLSDMPREEPVLYSAEDLAWERKTLEKAIALTSDNPVAQERLALVMRHFRAHELFALATHTPFKLNRSAPDDAVNKPLLEYYLRDDGSTLAEAVRYYEQERNIPPATGELEMRLGYLPMVIANYSKGIGSLLNTISKHALTSLTHSLSAPERAAALRSKSLEILHANLPKDPRPERVRFFEGLLNKTVHVPRSAAMPNLDGSLSDPEWAKAAVVEGFSVRGSILASKNHTIARVLRVGDKLVVGITSDQIGPIWAQTPADTLTGTHIWRESGVEVVFGPVDLEGKRSETCQYDINALGAFRGFFKAKDNREGVQCAVRLDESKRQFIVEASLPLKTVEYDYSSPKELSFNIVRMIYTRNSYGADELLTWHPTALGTLIFE